MEHKTDCMKWPTYSISLYTWNALHIGNKLHTLSLEWDESLNEIKILETKGRQLKSPVLLINPNSWKQVLTLQDFQLAQSLHKCRSKADGSDK